LDSRKEERELFYDKIFFYVNLRRSNINTFSEIRNVSEMLNQNVV